MELNWIWVTGNFRTTAQNQIPFAIRDECRADRDKRGYRKVLMWSLNYALLVCTLRVLHPNCVPPVLCCINGNDFCRQFIVSAGAPRSWRGHSQHICSLRNSRKVQDVLKISYLNLGHQTRTEKIGARCGTYQNNFTDKLDFANDSAAFWTVYLWTTTGKVRLRREPLHW